MLPSALWFCIAILPISFATQQAPLHDSTPLLPKATSNELLYLHRKLVETVSTPEKEKKVGLWLKSYLEDKKFTVELQEVAPKRYNLLAYGKKRETPILVSSHIDTVPPFLPYYYNETSDVIGGRGSVDAKASVAAQIIAVQSLNQKLHDDISLLFVVGEETGGDGMRAFSALEDRPQYEVVIFGEPTEGKLVCGHKGILGFTITTSGKAAHSGYPWLGVSANDIMIEALGKLVRLREHLPWSEKYGNTTMNFGYISGGAAANVVAEKATAKIVTRIAAGTPKVLKGLIIDALKDVKAAAEDMGGGLDIEYMSEGFPPVDFDCGVNGFQEMTVNYGTDAPNLEGDHRRYLYGPGSIFVAHGDHEALKRRHLEQAVLDYRRLIIATSMMHGQEKERFEM
ncbi:Zn-dependent exopeptidase [Polyplosphaeria fusca]|uniref:Zn-dependent exopeptidase n=1 Tax=Polyplosphaeria fusca TaxID=682080 RepID=A0A9P4V0P4_9PLEO|nr:Zn-dependent exopeptidase [Polyplosphaeria fusca]